MPHPPDLSARMAQTLFASGQDVLRVLAALSASPALASEISVALKALQQEFAQRHARLWQTREAASDMPSPMDARFSTPAWASSPFYDHLRRAYLLNSEFLQRCLALLPIEEDKTRQKLQFATRQCIDALSPANFAATNPEFIQTALATQGASITTGIQNLLADLARGRISMSDETAFEVGRNLAATAGAVIFENEVIQLIQYAPLTAQVGTRPLVIIPPCINKYYILDLQPENSLVRQLVAEGHTVFLVSWRNPQAAQGTWTWDHYIEHGVLAALAVARDISRSAQVNALGFCVGGTLLTTALAVARARGENPVASLTLLTTLLDFSDPGELGVFIDEAAVAARETSIGQGGLMTGQELAAVFSSLRANDLVWPYVVGNYLKGSKPAAFDLLYWNADGTNLPGPFAAWYLRHLYLENRLCQPGQLNVCGVPVDLGKVDMPTFLYASREDHIVPWQSAYRSRHLLGGPTTFLLGASGHIAGVINPPAKNRRSYWCNPASPPAQSEAEQWLASAREQPGSWWPAWFAWLREFSGKSRKSKEKLGNTRYPVIEFAPGRYVCEKAS